MFRHVQQRQAAALRHGASSPDDATRPACRPERPIGSGSLRQFRWRCGTRGGLGPDGPPSSSVNDRYRRGRFSGGWAVAAVVPTFGAGAGLRCRRTASCAGGRPPTALLGDARANRVRSGASLPGDGHAVAAEGVSCLEVPATLASASHGLPFCASVCAERIGLRPKTLGIPRAGRVPTARLMSRRWRTLSCSFVGQSSATVDLLTPRFSVFPLSACSSSGSCTSGKLGAGSASGLWAPIRVRTAHSGTR